ncbi:MAG: hypothetical protein JXA10_15185 [Anaerolineae bacterium]|nr:hypothetical protein [Anaerolineae bacterium]
MLVLSAMGLILLRVGLPVLALVTIGLLIDRWQTRRMETVNTQYAMGTIAEDAAEAVQVEEDIRLKRAV